MLVPIARHFILCDQVHVERSPYHRLSLLGVLSKLHSTAGPRFPMLSNPFNIFLMLAGFHGDGVGRIEIARAGTNQVVHRTGDHQLTLGADTLALRGLQFRILTAQFDEPGLYEVQFWYNDTPLAQQPLLVE